MQRYQIAFAITLLAAIALALTLSYMWFHPQILRDPKRTDMAPSSGTPPPGSGGREASEPTLMPVQLTPQRMQSIGVKTGTVEFKQVHDQIRTTGNVEVDETELAYVQVRFAGWIQQVFADATYQSVRKGQPLFTIYSPGLVTTQQEYLLAKQNRDLLAQEFRSGRSIRSRIAVEFCNRTSQAVGNSRT